MKNSKVHLFRNIYVALVMVHMNDNLRLCITVANYIVRGMLREMDRLNQIF